VSGFAWADVLALLTSIAFGTLSAVVPIANAETYVIASQVSAIAGPVPIAIGVGIGQAIGKLLLFLGVRRGKEFAIVRRRREQRQRQRQSKPVGPARAKFRAIVAKLLDLVGQKRWGLPIVGIAAVVGIPPLYAVALIAGATTMRTILFALVVLVGRITRFVLVALGITGLHDWFI
jgi:membrane protein YqaA with SNARE-associated domain